MSLSGRPHPPHQAGHNSLTAVTAATSSSRSDAHKRLCDVRRLPLLDIIWSPSCESPYFVFGIRVLHLHRNFFTRTPLLPTLFTPLFFSRNNLCRFTHGMRAQYMYYVILDLRPLVTTSQYDIVIRLVYEC